jgi:hypothetical protein
MVEVACANAPFPIVSVLIQVVQSGLDQSEVYSVWRTVTTLVLYRSVLSIRMPWEEEAAQYEFHWSKHSPV